VNHRQISDLAFRYGKLKQNQIFGYMQLGRVLVINARCLADR